MMVAFIADPLIGAAEAVGIPDSPRPKAINVAIKIRRILFSLIGIES